MRIKSVLVDDEILNLKNLEIILNQNFAEIEILGLFQNVSTAREFIEANPIDLVFLDISMPVEDGFDLLGYFQAPQFEVIFITAHEEYAIKAIKVGALDYILKPIIIEELQAAIAKVAQVIQQKPLIKPKNSILLNYEGGKSIVDFSEIIYLKGFDNLTSFYLTDKRKITVSKTLKNFETVLDQNFYRIHKSYIVNLNYIHKIETKISYLLEMKDGTQLPISRRNYKALNDVLKKEFQL